MQTDDTPATVTPPAVQEAIEELEALIHEAATGRYKPDSFTFQPLRRAYAEQDEAARALLRVIRELRGYTAIEDAAANLEAAMKGTQ